jgi:hypothetical protein
VQDTPASPSDTLLLLPLKCLHKTNERIQERPHPGDSRPVLSPSRLIITGCFNSWLFINDRPSKTPGARTLTLGLLQTMTILIHIKCRSNDDHFSSPQWESFFFSILGVSTPALLGPAQPCACNAFAYDPFGDHLQTCQTKSAASQVHDWVVYKLGSLLGYVGHRVKMHNITPATGKERGDLEVKDYVVMQKPLPQATRLPPPYSDHGLYHDPSSVWVFTLPPYGLTHKYKTFRW